MTDIDMPSPSQAGKPNVANPKEFLFESKYLIRVVYLADHAWFVGADLAKILGYHDAVAAARLLDDDEKGTQEACTPGGNQALLIFSEPGFYKLIARSSKPKARELDRFVRHVVLPKIRKTDSSSLPGRDAQAARTFNATARLLGEVRRTYGPRVAAMLAPTILARAGLHGVEPALADVFRQREFDLSPATAQSPP